MVCKATMHLVMLKSLVPALIVSLQVPLLYLFALTDNASVLAQDVSILAFDALAQAFKVSPT